MPFTLCTLPDAETDRIPTSSTCFNKVYLPRYFWSTRLNQSLGTRYNQSLGTRLKQSLGMGTRYNQSLGNGGTGLRHNSVVAAEAHSNRNLYRYRNTI